MAMYRRSSEQQIVCRLGVIDVEFVLCSYRPHGQVEIDKPHGVSVVCSEACYFDRLSGVSVVLCRLRPGLIKR